MRLQQTALLIASAAALAACGAATPSPSASPTSSPAPTSAPVVAAPSPTPARPSFEPLFLAFTDVDPDPGVLMLASGQTTGPIPSEPVIGGDGTLTISGPLGGRLIGTDGHSIVALSSDGTLTTLEKNVAGSPSVVGRDDGQAWAWAVQTNSPACGSKTRAAFDVYTDDGNGARKIASASFGAGVTQVSLAAWTSAGIVASGDNGCGLFSASTLAVSPAILIDPATGAAIGLASRIGTDCSFQDIADDGTIACYVGGSAPGIRVITPDGMQTRYTVPGLTSQQCINGGVALSADASVAAVSITCHMKTSTQLFLLDLASGHVVTVTGAADLAPTLWTPDDILIATEFGVHRTYSVTPAGLATLINAKYAAQTSIG
jgi:hypothetical protein